MSFPLDEDWNVLFSELIHQTVFAFPDDVISSFTEMDQELCRKWKRKIYEQVGFFYRYLFQQDQVIRVLKEKQIAVVVIKGSAAAMYYPRPEYRTMGDVDLPVRPEDMDAACHALTAAGYELEVPKKTHNNYIRLHGNNLEIELHRKH